MTYLTQEHTYLLHNGMPVPLLGLPKQAYRGIPEAVVALQEPAPIRCEGQENPGRNSERARKVRSRVIDCDDEIHGSNLRREIIDVGQLIDVTINQDRGVRGCGLRFESIMVSILETNPANT